MHYLVKQFKNQTKMFWKNPMDSLDPKNRIDPSYYFVDLKHTYYVSIFLSRDKSTGEGDAPYKELAKMVWVWKSKMFAKHLWRMSVYSISPSTNMQYRQVISHLYNQHNCVEMWLPDFFAHTTTEDIMHALKSTSVGTPNRVQLARKSLLLSSLSWVKPWGVDLCRMRESETKRRNLIDADWFS